MGSWRCFGGGQVVRLVVHRARWHQHFVLGVDQLVGRWCLAFVRIGGSVVVVVVDEQQDLSAVVTVAEHPD